MRRSKFASSLKKAKPVGHPYRGHDGFGFLPLGSLKSKVYSKKPATVQQLKYEIITNTGEVENQIRIDVVETFDHRVVVCC